jgi:hypothetical protein
MRRTDYRSALLFAVTVIPGSALGAIITGYLPRRLFDGIFGALLVVAATFLFARPARSSRQGARIPRFAFRSVVIDKEGTRHEFSYDLLTGPVISFVVGLLSGMLGIGGSIMHALAMVSFLNFPVHVATATSHLVIAIMALTATSVQIISGDLAHGLHQTIALVIGVVPGAQVGAWLSNKIHGSAIVRGLAVALSIVGVRIFLMAF